MSVIIRQPCGLGDILFCQKIAAFFKYQGYKVIWPVIPQYNWIYLYLKAYEFPVHYTPVPSDTIINLNRVVDGFGIMQSKYEIAQVDWQGWQKFVELKRNNAAEKRLFDFINPPEKYNLICNTFASPPYEQKISINIRNEFPNVYIENVAGMTPFDWCLLIERATELHFVDTCFTMIIELLQLSSRKMYLYPRKGDTDRILTKGLFIKPWNYCD